MTDTAKVAAKMGWKPGMLARCEGLRPALADLFGALPQGPDASWLLGAAETRAELALHAAALCPAYRTGGHLWLLYPKKSGRIASDITRDHGWEALTERDFLPVTQVAVDADWSALRFRLRAEIARLTRKF